MTVRPPLAPVTGLSRTSNLPPPPPRTRATQNHDHDSDATASPTPGTTARTTAPLAAVGPGGRPEPRPQPAHKADTVRAISLSLPLPLVEALKTRARADRITHAEVLMDAVTAQQDNLTELIENAKPHTQTGAIFTRHQRRGDAPTYVALSLRMMSGNVAALDDLTHQHNADSRSQLCSAALTHYLNV